MPAFGCKETPGMAWLVDTLPLGPVPIASKAEKFHHFQGGWEAYRGTGAIGKKVATQVLLLESNFECFLERKV